MSIEKKEVIKCPNCGKKNNFIVWQSLNGDIDPDAKQQLLNGTLFLYECKKCGHKTNVDYPILYHDMGNQAMVYYLQQDTSDASKNIFNNAEGTMGFLLDNYKKRIVNSTNALREKAIIFDNGLDDRIIEIIKFFYYAKVMEQHPESNINNVFFFISNNKYYLQFLGDSTLTAEISLDTYKVFESDFKEIISKTYNDETVIDFNWVNKILKELHNN